VAGKKKGIIRREVIWRKFNGNKTLTRKKKGIDDRREKMGKKLNKEVIKLKTSFPKKGGGWAWLTINFQKREKKGPSLGRFLYKISYSEK